MRSKRGLTLIELVIVVGILGIGLTAISLLFVSAITANLKAQRIAAASNRAEMEMEKLKSGGFSGALADPELFPNPYTVAESNPDGTGLITFPVSDLPSGQGAIQIQFYRSPSGYYPNLKQVSVVIVWGGSRATRGRLRLAGLIANRP